MLQRFSMSQTFSMFLDGHTYYAVRHSKTMNRDPTLHPANS
jgi:hypothetical protein